MDSRFVERLVCSLNRDDDANVDSIKALHIPVMIRALVGTVEAIEIAGRNGCFEDDDAPGENLGLISEVGTREYDFLNVLIRSMAGILNHARPAVLEALIRTSVPASLLKMDSPPDPYHEDIVRLFTKCPLNMMASTLLLYELGELKDGDTAPEALLHRAMLLVYISQFQHTIVQSKVTGESLPLLMLPLLRRLALLHGNTPICQSMPVEDTSVIGTQAQSLCAFLKLPDINAMQHACPSDILVWSQCLFEYANSSDLAPVQPLKAFQFVSLPESYDDLFQIAAEGVCDRCQVKPTHPAICLVCGDLLCAAQRCCRSDSLGELTQHTRQHCGDQGVFLMLYTSEILFIFDGYSVNFNSPYLDIHGEEDIGRFLP